MPGMGIGSKTLLAIVMVYSMSVWRYVAAQPPPQPNSQHTPTGSPLDFPTIQPAIAPPAFGPPVGSLPRRLPPVPTTPIADPTVDGEMPPMKWWSGRVTQQVLQRERWVSFDLETLLLDTLANSPRIMSVGFEASSTFQRIIQQDAAFDSTVLLSSNLGATNDPVGNTLTTGGADRLREKSLNFRGGARKTTRTGTELEWSQEIGFLDSNSSFFVPRDQGNARLSLSLTKPLLSRGGRYYNERLVTQARIENRVAWEDMRGEVEQRIADVIAAYWQLYEIRAQLTQQRELLARSRHIEQLLVSRQHFDAALIEITKAKQRVARRADQVIDLEADLQKRQARLAALVGSEALIGAESDLELIPIAAPTIDQTQWNLRDAVAQALENRPEVRAATHDVELSALELRVTRVELEPQLNWVFNGYLSQLNGASKVARSFGEQFANAPGISTGLEFEFPRGQRAFRAQHREALLRAKQRSQRLREVIQQTQFEVETALIDLDRFAKQLISKRNVLATAITEENILTVQWRIIGGDDSRVGIKLENLLDAQQRRTDAEKDLVTVESAYMIALVQLQRAMGTLLIHEGIQPHQSQCSGEINFLHQQYPIEIPADPTGEDSDARSPRLESVGPDDATLVDPTSTDSPPIDLTPIGTTTDDSSTSASTDTSTKPIPSGRLGVPVVHRAERPTRGVENSVTSPIGGSAAQETGAQSQPNAWNNNASRLQMPSYTAPGAQSVSSPIDRAAWQTPSEGWNQ